MTATGLPFAGGQITPEELEAGEIKHVIGIALFQADKDFSWPASRSDGLGCCGSLCIPEGARFRLHPCVDVDKTDMHRVGKIIAKAAQTYGFVVWDKADTTSIRAKNPKSYTQLGLPDPYPKIFEGKDQWTVLDGFPWDKLQFLPNDYGSKSHAGKAGDELEAKSQQVDELLGRWISKTGPGAAVLVIQKHDIPHKRGYGLARLNQDAPVPITPATNFRLASLTKQFTAMAVAMLIEEKKLNLNDRLSQFFPDQPAREIRIHHLLHHTAGLREYDDLFREFGMIGGAEFRAVGACPPGFEPKNSDVLSLLKGQTLLKYPPGRVFAYSNSGYVCLAAIIEKASGLSYSQFLKCRIFDTLGMTHTFVGANPDRQMADLAYSYDFRGVGASTDIDYSPLNTVYGDDGVYSNLEDLYKWDQALVCACDQTPPAKRLVSNEMLDLIFRPGKLNDGASTGYGFGWSVAATRSYVDHDGEWLGFRTYIRRYLNDHFCIIVLSNFASVDPVAIAERIDAIYFPPGSQPNWPRVVSLRRAATKSAKSSNANAH